LARIGEKAVTIALIWKAGFEVELLAPAGLSRKSLAERVAARHGGAIRRFFHPQSEPSKVPGTPIFENLTLGFEVTDADGQPVARFVDDLTLQADLNKQARPVDGWYRILADDNRLLRLVMRHCDGEADLSDVLRPFAALFGTEPVVNEAGMVRVADEDDASVAIAAPLPGERERGCEIITMPIETGHEAALTMLLEDAQALGFLVPKEGATHIHFDAERLCTARAIATLVATLDRFGPALKQLVGVNENCVRLGAWPPALATRVMEPSFLTQDWPDVQSELRQMKLTKYCDFNLANIALGNRAKHTFEVRVLPATLDAGEIIRAAALFEALLCWCCDDQFKKLPSSISALIEELPLSDVVASGWLEKAAASAAGVS
jgi:hypothetical protein